MYGLATSPPDPYIFAANLVGTLLGLWYTVVAATMTRVADADRLALAGLASLAIFGGAGAAQAFGHLDARTAELVWGASCNAVRRRERGERRGQIRRDRRRDDNN